MAQMFLMNCLSAVWLLEMFDVCLWRDSDCERERVRARTPSCDTLLCLIWNAHISVNFKSAIKDESGMSSNNL